MGFVENVGENSASRIVGDSEEECVKVTIAAEKKFGKSRVQAVKEAARLKHAPSKIRKCKHRMKPRISKSLGIELFQSALLDRSKIRSAVIEKEVANIIETGKIIGFEFKEDDMAVREALASREEEDDERLIDRYGQ